MITTLLAVAIAAAPVPRQAFDTTFAVNSGGRLSIENMTGKVTVRTWDRDEMRVRANDRRAFEIDRTRSVVQIENQMRRGMPGSIEFEITVPATFDLDIEGINLSADVADVTGEVNVETVNGNITLAALDGRVSAETVQGRISVRNSRGELELSSSNGGVDVTNHEGELKVEGINGEITLRDVRSGSVEAETVNGPIEFGGQIRDNGRYRFETHQGNLTLYIPENTNASVSVETWRGEIEAEFPVQVQRIGRQDRNTFVLGNGSARIEIESFGGRVYLRRPQGR